MIGPFGPSHIVTRRTGDYLHFLQMFGSGPLYATTVFDRETVNGKLMAVHTRHEYTDVALIGFTVAARAVLRRLRESAADAPAAVRRWRAGSPATPSRRGRATARRPA